MPNPPQGSSLAGSFRIFGVAGISVYVHWSWLLVGYLVLQYRTNFYESWAWNVAEYLSLFFFVLLHEFGHSLACRQVGGRADEIVLWPLGGIAFVQPPARPGAVLWSIAAGPLVNLILVPVTIVAFVVANSQGLNHDDKGLGQFLFMIMFMNFFLFIFNMLPIYPLDGGQILQALLWFAIGQATSLMVVSIIGMVGVVGFIGLVIYNYEENWWFGVIAAFTAFRCWAGFQQARVLARLEQAPRHRDAACPSCDSHPLKGPFWQCEQCGARFDTFTHQAECPGCGKQSATTTCPECQRAHPIWAWYDTDEKSARAEWEEPRNG
jgi:Zn-dependent protease